jgi:hypothetical protein
VTSTAEIERALITALDTIRTNWAALTQPTSGNGGGGGSKSADSITGLDRCVSLRHEVTITLNGWARLVVEQLHLTEGLPLGTDTLGLASLLASEARWFSGHEAASDALDEIAGCADRVRRAATSSRAEWVHIGYCPTLDDGLICWGDVKAWPHAEPPMAPFCQRCGLVMYVDEWERIMRVDSAIVPHNKLIEFIREEFGREVNPATLRVWLHRKVISVCGVDESGQALYDKGAIIYALLKKWDAGFDLQMTAM